MEWIQRGNPQKVFTWLYRWYLRNHKFNLSRLYIQMETILEQRVSLPEEVIVVATHFGLAHQLAAIKQKLETKKGIKITLVVQVTDDSPQYIWYVPNSNLTFVPSSKTKHELERYAKEAKLDPVKIEVLPYPINPYLAEKFPGEKIENRRLQLDKLATTPIHVCVPVSGAAVGTNYLLTVIQELHQKSPRFVFHVVSRTAPFTKKFLTQIENLSYTRLYVSIHDRELVEMYDILYNNEVISLEITKPSEQAFKALLSTNQKGGSTLLFAPPVGRQEYDNLDFLCKYSLTFCEDERDMLWKKSVLNQSLSDIQTTKLFVSKGKIRGMEIPEDPREAANFVWWTHQSGILGKLNYHGSLNPKQSDPETQFDGVEKFWQRVKELL